MKNHTMKKLSSILIIIITILSITGCNRDKKIPIREYTEKSDFVIQSYDFAPMPTTMTSIELGIGVTINRIIPEQSLIITQVNNKYGLMNYDGIYIYNNDVDLITYNYNCITIRKNFDSTIINYNLNKTITLKNGVAIPLYGDIIAFYPDDLEHKIVIKDYENNELFNLYDGKRQFNEIYNYGKYLIYENIEFNEFQVYDLKGEKIFAKKKSNPSDKLYYIYGDNMLYVNYEMVSDSIVVMNVLIEMKDFTEKFVNQDNPITAVYNIARGYFALGEGYSFMQGKYNSYYTKIGNSYLCPSSNGVTLTKEFAVLVDKTFNKISVYDKILSLQNTIENALDVSNYDNTLTYAKIIDGELKYGISSLLGKTIFDFDYDYVSEYVSSTAIAYKKVDDGKQYYQLSTTDSGKNVKELNFIPSMIGCGYYFIDRDDTNSVDVYNFKNELLGSFTGHKYEDNSSNLGEPIYFTTTKDNKFNYIHLFR